ncbi:MAG: hypothetical protein ACO2Y5_04770 [Nitrosopumilaceae archaeon]
MKVQVVEPGEAMADTVKKILSSKNSEVLDTRSSGVDKNEKMVSINANKLRQMEQKQELLVGLTNLLYKKFEEMNPTKKYSKFEMTDISWYKNKISS